MSRWPTPEPQSALVVLVPEAEKLLAPFRAAHDPAAAAGVPAHITVLFPFVSPSRTDDTTLDRLRACFRAQQPLSFELIRVRLFPGVVYLAPEPDASFRALTLAVWAAFPECPPYEGKHSDIVPHLTVGSVTDEQVLKSLTQNLTATAGQFLPIGVRATEITLMDNRHGPWAVVTTFALGGCEHLRWRERKYPGPTTLNVWFLDRLAGRFTT